MAARLGLQVRLISGDDTAGHPIRAYLRSQNVDIELVRVVPNVPTPVTAVMITGTGVAGSVGCRDDRIRLSPQDLLGGAVHDAIAASDALLLTFEQPETPPFAVALEGSPGAYAAFTAALAYRLVSSRRPADEHDYLWASAAMVATQSFGDIPGAMPEVDQIDRIVRLASAQQ